MSRRFVWISQAPEPPRQWDLRLRGWRLLADDDGAAPLLLDHKTKPTRLPKRAARRMAVLGIVTGAERAKVLARGFGDALSPDIALKELAARIERMADDATRLPRELSAGPVTLDLFLRDARAGGGWLGLHPREFNLLWHLAETPGHTVSRADLLMAVWRLKHDPGTNSLEVHISRLRSKLAAAGVTGLVETAPEGGYRLAR